MRVRACVCVCLSEREKESVCSVRACSMGGACERQGERERYRGGKIAKYIHSYMRII